MPDEVNVPINLTVDSNAQKRLTAIRGAMKDVEKGAEAAQAKIDRASGAIAKMQTVAAKLQKINVGRAEGLTQSAGRALSGLGASALGGTLGGAADVMQLGGVLAEAAKGAGLLSAGVSTLVPAALIAAPAVAGIALAVDNFNKTIEPTAALLSRSISQLDAYYAAIQTGTRETIQKQLDSLRIQKEAADNQLAQMKATLDQAFASEQSGFGGDLAARIKFAIASTRPEFQELGGRIEGLGSQSKDLEGKMAGLEAAMNSAAVAANEARSKFAQGLEHELETERLIAGKDDKAIQQSIADKERDLAVMRKWLEANAERVAGDEELAAIYDEVEKKAKALERQIKRLDGVLDVIGTTAGARSTDIPKEEQERIDRLIGVQKRYNDDVASIEERALEQRAALQERYNDQLVDIAKKAADDAASALRKLTEQREDLSRDLGRDLAQAERDSQAEALDIRIQAQREDEQAAREHYRNLERIRRQAEDREFELIMNRDFLGLFMSRRQTTRDLEEAGGDFAASKQERQIATTQELSDLQQQIQRERNERLIAYQQSLQDAQIAYNRERMEIARQKQAALIAAQQQYNQELTRLSAKVTRELQIRQRAYDAELQMAATFGQARINAEAKVQQALLAQAQSRLAALNPPSVTNNTARTVNYAPTYNVTGGQNMSPQQLAQYVDSRVARTMVRLVG